MHAYLFCLFIYPDGCIHDLFLYWSRSCILLDLALCATDTRSWLHSFFLFIILIDWAVWQYHGALFPYAYHILFYFPGNKREKKLKTRGAIISPTKYVSTIMSHLLFMAINFPSKYSATWYTYGSAIFILKIKHFALSCYLLHDTTKISMLC
jgi:hypothetical protein